LSTYQAKPRKGSTTAASAVSIHFVEIRRIIFGGL